MLLITIFIIFFIKHSDSDCVLHTGPSDRQLEVKLHNYLLSKNEELHVQPNKNLTTIAIKFILKTFKFDNNEEVFSIYNWVILQWEDPRLQWNATEYEGVDKTIVNSFDIWTPLRTLTNKEVKGAGHAYSLPYEYCQVDNKGQVMCFLYILHRTTCITKLDNWPYDSQTCTFNLGIVERNKENLVFTFNKSRGIFTERAEYGPGWDIIDYAVGENATGVIKLYLTFVVERHAKGLGALVVFPLIVVAMSLTTIFILFFIKHSTSDCVLHTEPSDRLYEVKLHKDVFYNDNNFLVIPNKNGTTVTLKFMLKNFKFDTTEEQFGIYSWMFFQWKDPRIQWNSSDYGGVDKTIIHSVNIWTPLRILTNLGDVSEFGGEYYPYTYCQVDNTGKVLCVLRVSFATMCITKLDDWPYDSQTCIFNFGIKKSNKDNVTFTFNQSRGISAFGAEYGSGWDIVYNAVGENATDAIKFNLTFVLERHATGLASLVVFPLVIVGTMTVSSMFLDAYPYLVSSNSLIDNLAMSLTTIFILFFIKHSASDCVLHTEPSDRQFEVKLLKDVFFNDTDLFVIPNKDGITVTINFILKNFKFDKNEELFDIYSWMFFQWEDPRIQWNASDYGGIDKTSISNINFWTPLGILTNLGDVTGFSGEHYHYRYCEVDNTGKILCVVQIFHETMCIAKLNDWPYDSQTCIFNFGINKSNKDKVTFTFNQSRGISALGAENGSGWDIVDYAVRENATDAIKFNLTFVVERHATGLAALVVFPLVIVAKVGSSGNGEWTITCWSVDRFR
ncbi:unnamed protein product, partial [Brenthis ino]